MCKTGNSIDGQRRPKAVTNSYSDPNNPDQYVDIMTTIDLCNWQVLSDVIVYNMQLILIQVP